jgi:diaminohydroxyphosphoribosylaminopyrimidine deaminase/5-amino-6-(5-phosphoribosylamino)uracil reductase
MTRKRPFVRSKIAMSLDGRTALANGESQWITSPPAREDVHRFRAQSSAILTAIGTVLVDNPTLNARVDFPLVQPVRVVLDSQLKLMPNAKMRDIDGAIWVLTCSENAAKKATLERAGFDVYVLPAYHGRLDLHAVMAFLVQKEINNVFVEAGASLNGALLEANLVDEWLIYMAPCVLGDKGRGIFVLPELTAMKNKSRFHWQNVRHVGADLRLTLSRKSNEVA